MASPAQIAANRLNAAASTGPKTSEGKARSSRNRLKFGLFSTQHCVQPEEASDHARLSKALWKELAPHGPVEELLAVEVVRVAWRLQRCAAAEAEDGNSAPTQAAVDRARASAHSSLRRLLHDLRQFQSDRWLRAEVLNPETDHSQLGIADTHRVMKGLADNERLKALFLSSPIGVDPINRNAPPPELAATIRTQSPCGADAPVRTGPPGPVRDPGDQATVRAKVTPEIPRNAPCLCHSGLKYKRCCGAAAPPVLTSQSIVASTRRFASALSHPSDIIPGCKEPPTHVSFRLSSDAASGTAR